MRLSETTSLPAIENAVRVYLHEVLGILPTIQAWPGSETLPYYLHDTFQVRHLTWQDWSLLLAIDMRPGRQGLAFMRGQLDALRQQAGKTTGTVRFEVDGHTVIADLPKRVEYDQAKLKDAVEALRKWGENPEDYVGLEVKVAEATYTAWPPAVRQLFEPARTVKTGKPTYQLEVIHAGPVPAAAKDPRFGGGQ